MIGIIGAMGVEIRALAEKLENKEVKTIAGVEYMKGTIHGKSVVLAVCGIGKVFAAICAQTMILTYHPDVIINSGVAGTLTDELSIGDIAVSTHVVQHDMDTSPLGDPKGLISGINVIAFPADGTLVDKFSNILEEKDINFKTGVIASGDQFLASKEKKDEIVKNFSAIAGEMEGGAIGHVCFVNNVKFCVLRAISDCADGTGAEDYTAFLNKAADAAVSVMDAFLRD